jgi:protein-S-isoprenylcysteine O-methyltransferase Ste14
MKYIVYITGATLLCIGAYHRLQAARSGESIDRRHEGWPILIGIRLSALGAVVAIFRAFRADDPPWAPTLQWAVTGLFVVSCGWLAWMFISLGRNITDTVVTRRESVFVCHGPYKYVRNPMYIGILIGGTSLAAVAGSWVGAVFAVATFTLLAIRTRTEERFLLARFGDTYKRYMNEVGRFWPNIV